MDLLDYTPKTDFITVELEVNGTKLTNPDGTPMTIDRWLPHSKEYKKIRHEQSDRLIESKKAKITSQEAEDLGIELIAKTTKGWNITVGGEQPKFSVKKAVEIYEKAFWIPELLEEKVQSHDAFTGN